MSKTFSIKIVLIILTRNIILIPKGEKLCGTRDISDNISCINYLNQVYILSIINNNFIIVQLY